MIPKNGELFAKEISLLGFHFEGTAVCCGGKVKHIYGHPTKLTLKVNRKTNKAVLTKRNVLAYAGALDLKKFTDDESERKKILDILREKISQASR